MNLSSASYAHLFQNMAWHQSAFRALECKVWILLSTTAFAAFKKACFHAVSYDVILQGHCLHLPEVQRGIFRWFRQNSKSFLKIRNRSGPRQEP